jgi:polyhydroxyalkanoate synthesis regulator phasin
MAQRDSWKRYFDAGLAFTATTKARAEEIARDLLKAGEIQRDQFQTQVDEIIERSRRNSDHLVAIVRKEVSSQLADLGTTLRDELRALERRLNTMSAAATSATTEATPGPPTESEPAKPSATRAPRKVTQAPAEAKVPAKKSPAKKSPAKKAAVAAEAPAQKVAPAKKAAPKKAVAKKSAPAPPN